MSDELAKRMFDAMISHYQNAQYTAALNNDEFACRVTQGLRKVCGDYHIVVSPRRREPPNRDKHTVAIEIAEGIKHQCCFDYFVTR